MIKPLPPMALVYLCLLGFTARFSIFGQYSIMSNSTGQCPSCQLIVEVCLWVSPGGITYSRCWPSNVCLLDPLGDVVMNIGCVCQSGGRNLMFQSHLHSSHWKCCRLGWPASVQGLLPCACHLKGSATGI